MNLADMHPEDIKASIRKQFGTIRNFELSRDLPRGSVHEVLRRRRWARIERAIESVISASPSEKTDSKRKTGAHGLSAEAK
jgi:lambda repressor-like predicted transcriptional regulator